MKKIRIAFAAIAFAAISFTASADEGMWLVNMIESRLHEKMADQGLMLSSKMIYDEDDVALCDAVVSLAFGCSGSMISEDGLMITNHHCAYADVHALSTTEHNYLEDGFKALSRDEELPAPSAKDGVWFLKKVMDVTDEVAALRDSLHAGEKVMGMRKVYGIMEKRYAEKYKGQGEVMCSSYWGGQKFFMALYQVYHDVRLVAAPPVCMASFGAEVDNWEWPQQKADFAIYRIYTAPDGSPAEYSKDNVPFHPKRTLTISTTGVKDGDFTMIIGYPGHTNRYSSSFAVENTAKVVNPIQSEFKKKQMEILDKWMNADPAIRLKYADRYFMLSNVQEIREGEIYCYNRFRVPETKVEMQEKPLQEWIDADAQRKEQWGTLIPDLKEMYSRQAWLNEQQAYFKETVVGGYRINRYSNSVLNAARDSIKAGKKEFVMIGDKRVTKTIERFDSEMDIRTERELFDFSLGAFLTKVDRQFWGDYLRKTYDRLGGNIQAVCDTVWSTSVFTDKDRFVKAVSEPHTIEFYQNDPAVQFSKSPSMTLFNKKRTEIEKGSKSLSKQESEYKKALYMMRLDKGVPQYADANSTMRLTYGTVGPIKPADAVTVDSRTSTEGILEKYKPEVYIFSLKPEIKALYEKKEWGRWGENGKMYVNFLSNNDITGGNSGSPVMDACGRLVGLAFDGNKEGLAGDTFFDPDMNKTISVDIRYVLWTLEKYMGMGYLLDEMSLSDESLKSFYKSHCRNADKKARR